MSQSPMNPNEHPFIIGGQLPIIAGGPAEGHSSDRQSKTIDFPNVKPVCL